MRYAPMIACLALSACVAGTADHTGVVSTMNLEYQVGEELMNDCTLRNERCLEWLQFRKDWEDEMGYMVTFEKSLAMHKARIAKGQAV